MSRIPERTIGDAPEVSKPLLEAVVGFSPTGKPLALHAQMAHSPAVLTAYSGLRRAGAEHGRLPQPVGAALMLAVAAAIGNDYTLRITTRLAAGAGWTDAQTAALIKGDPTGDGPLDALAAVLREAVTHAGHVGKPAWQAALDEGWTDEHLADAFVYLGLTAYTAYFLNYAQTEVDF